MTTDHEKGPPKRALVHPAAGRGVTRQSSPEVMPKMTSRLWNTLNTSR
jgi:hypothetical protein